MLICERYLLVFLEKWKHRKSILLGPYQNVCLAGAGIMDLILREKLLIEENKLRVIDTNPTGVEFLDEILTMIKDSKKIHKIRKWVYRISRYHSIQRYTLVFKSLESQGILKFERRVSAKIFFKFIYELTKPEVIQSLMEQIQKVFSDNLDPDIELLCLLSLIQISRLIKVSVSKEYRNVVKYRIEQLVLFGNYDPSQLEMILNMKKACKRAMRDDYASII